LAVINIQQEKHKLVPVHWRNWKVIESIPLRWKASGFPQWRGLWWHMTFLFLPPNCETSVYCWDCNDILWGEWLVWHWCSPH